MARTPTRAPRRALVALVALLGVSALAPAQASAACRGADAHPNKVSRATVESATLCLLNRERTSRDLRRLKSHSRLRLAAVRHARDMARRNYFSHDSLSGTDLGTRIKRTGYLRSASNWALGENIAWGGGRYSTPRSIVEMWMDSPGHRANILNRRFREIGIGVAIGSPTRDDEDAATYVNDFGTRR
jgi:uncharacterized protein YkwD